AAAAVLRRFAHAPILWRAKRRGRWLALDPAAADDEADAILPDFEELVEPHPAIAESRVRNIDPPARRSPHHDEIRIAALVDRHDGRPHGEEFVRTEAAQAFCSVVAAF